MTGGALLVALALATAPPPDASPDAIDAPVTKLPASFTECAEAYARALEGDETVEARFGCARRHAERHPGSDGSTYEMATASAHATAVANLYIDDRLMPAMEGRLREDKGTQVTAALLLRGFLRARRAADAAECDLYYDAFSGGTIRSVMFGSCAVSNADALIESLLRFQAAAALR